MGWCALSRGLNSCNLARLRMAQIVLGSCHRPVFQAGCGLVNGRTHANIVNEQCVVNGNFETQTPMAQRPWQPIGGEEAS